MAKDKDDITEIINELMWIMRNRSIEEKTLEDPVALFHNPTFKEISSLLEEVNPRWGVEKTARAFLEAKLTWEEYEELDDICVILFLCQQRKFTNLRRSAKFAAEYYINAEVCPVYLHTTSTISQALGDRILELEKEKSTVVGFFSRSVKEYKINRLKALRNEFLYNAATFKEALQDQKLIEGKDSRTKKVLEYCLSIADTIENSAEDPYEKKEQRWALGFGQ